MVDKLFLNWEEFGDMSSMLADRVAERYGNRIGIVVGLARGGILLSMIISDRIDKELTFMRVRSYKGVQVKGDPELVFDIQADIAGKSVLLVDDLSDTGDTFRFSVGHLMKRRPSEIVTAALHIKPWTKFMPDIYLEKTDKWVVYPWDKYRDR